MERPSDGTTSSSSVRRGVVSKVCLAGVVTGCLLQLTIRDYVPFPLAGLYYALPRPLLLLLAVAGGIASVRRLSRWISFGAVLLLAIWVAASDIAWHSSGATTPGTHTVVFWNVGHDLTDDVAFVDGFLDHAPAILGLVETGPLTPEWLAAWQARHRDYEFVIPHPGCLLAVRGRIRESGYQLLTNNSHVGWVDFDIDGRTVRAVVVDILANPWISRKEPLSDLSELLVWWNDVPLVVMGDFNTPDDSVWMADFRRDFRELFRTAGRGYVPTWPWPAPVLKLDQIWVNRFVDVHRAWQTTTWRSDHRPQWGEVSVLEGDNASAKRR